MEHQLRQEGKFKWYGKTMFQSTQGHFFSYKSKMSFVNSSPESVPLFTRMWDAALHLATRYIAVGY